MAVIFLKHINSEIKIKVSVHELTVNDYKLKKVGLKQADLFILYLGGAKGDRTPDLMAASHALSQLSYSPIDLCF